VTDLVIVLTTAPEPLAPTIARALVEEQLAACVNVLPPMASFYRWQGAVQRDVECQLLVKTTRARVEAVQARIGTLHSYELPEFIVLDVAGGSAGYVDWVRHSV
jgi:periplasmic divalent cation tolerance protein